MKTWSRDQLAVASLMRFDENVLVQLSDAVWLGRSQSVRARAKSPRKESTAFQLNREPRKETRFLMSGVQSSRSVSLRVLRGLGLVPIQLLVPRWKPGVGSGYVFSRPTPLGLSRLAGITFPGNGWAGRGPLMGVALPQ